MATFGPLEMNRRVQLFFSWWLCVIAAWIYLLCTGNVSGIGPVLSFLSHQDLAQQHSQSPWKRLWKIQKTCRESCHLYPLIKISHQGKVYDLSVRPTVWLEFSKLIVKLVKYVSLYKLFRLYFSVKLLTGNSLLILALAQALLLPLLPCLCSHTLFPTFSSVFWSEFDLERLHDP